MGTQEQQAVNNGTSYAKLAWTLGGNMEYVAVFSSLAILSILALLAKTIQSAGSETLVKISATVISSTFAFLLIIPIAFAMFMSLE
ncbi:Uncharacterised protein [Bordetella parapertussis]|nr:hypothetical protein AZ18_2151 [Bordetella bronchiseptica D993]KDS79200.1 hypothetical protein KM22_02142 [Bordetella bronchiseptica KM22]KFJ59250.1 putative membrane protein [Bordetella bronchiseptica]CFP46001.1 Uncharacterised protein [Bordetella pertussis]SQH16973.1 Uncharacterised protein [Bordetella parapertussis]